MIKKILKKIKQIIKDNYKLFVFTIVLLFILNIPLPYSIHTTGGLIDISKKVTIESEKDIKGSINMGYVTELRGNIFTCALSFIIPSWDLVKKDTSSSESDSNTKYRDDMLLKEANENAMIIAYEKANKKVTIIKQNIYIVLINEEAKTDLQIGDQILSVDETNVSSLSEYKKIIINKSLGETIKINVIDKNKKRQSRTAKIFEYKGVNVTGVLLVTDYVYKSDPKITFHFTNNESGPSGGLMMAIAIYNKLIGGDLTNNLVIAGTGTIDKYGNVGSIGGIEYKIKGAAKAGAKIFFTPFGDNYKDALKIIKKYKYKIKLVKVKTFDDSINYLKDYK